MRSLPRQRCHDERRIHAAEARSGFHDLMVHEKAIGTEYEIKLRRLGSPGDIDIEI